MPYFQGIGNAADEIEAFLRRWMDALARARAALDEPVPNAEELSVFLQELQDLLDECEHFEQANWYMPDGEECPCCINGYYADTERAEGYADESHQIIARINEAL